jgi:hypothetical protein
MPRGKRKVTDNGATTDQTEKNVTQELQQEPVIKTKGTRPGWKPAGQLPKLKAPPGFTPKWASSDPGKLTKLRAEGWILMKPSDNKGEEILKVDVLDGSPIASELRYRDLVAVMLPNEMKAQRDEWLRNENREAMKNVLNQTDAKLEEIGVQTYSPKGQAGRIIID